VTNELVHVIHQEILSKTEKKNTSKNVCATMDVITIRTSTGMLKIFRNCPLIPIPFGKRKK
jgi:hypothetical protein